MGILTGKYTTRPHPPENTRAAGRAKDMMEELLHAAGPRRGWRGLKPLATRARLHPGATVAGVVLLREDVVSR